MIHFDNVTKEYADRVVLDHINLTIHPQEFVTIVGPSGAGKSTLFQLLFGTIRPNEGQVRVDNLIIHELEPDRLQLYRRNVGMIFQDYKLLEQQTVAENIAFALEVCDAPEEFIVSRVEELLDEMGIQHVRDSFPHQLSGGEQQRTAIARALVHNPKLILADEPTGDLDPKQSREIIDLIRKIHGKGVTIIMASHDKTLVEYLGQRVIKIENGIVVGEDQGKYI